MPIGESSGVASSTGNILEKPFYFKVDQNDKRMTIRGKVNGLDQMVVKFGSVETDRFKSNVIMGGYRQIEANGEELFLIRQSTAGDKRAVSVGNMDTITANSLVSGPEGWRESRMRTDSPTAQNINFVQSVNTLGGTRLSAVITSSVSSSWRSFDLTIAAAYGATKFNTRIEDNVTGELLSLHQNEAEFMLGFGEDKFKRILVAGVNNLPLPQPYPVPAGDSFRLVFDFEKILTGLTLTCSMKGFALVLGRVQTVTNLTTAEVVSLPAAERWDSRFVKLTDGTKELCTFPATTAAPTPIGVPVCTIINGLWGLASMGNVPIPSGYWPLDGSVINAPWSILHGKTTPDTRGRVLANANSTKPIGTFAGTDMYSMVQSDLPNVQLSGSADYTPIGTVSTGSSAPYKITVGLAAVDWVYVPNSGTSNPVPRCGSGFSHTDTLASVFKGTAATIATNNIRLNGNVTQTQMDLRQATYYVTQLIKL